MARSATDWPANQRFVATIARVTDEEDDNFFHRLAGLLHDLLIVWCAKKRPDSR